MLSARDKVLQLLHRVRRRPCDGRTLCLRLLRRFQTKFCDEIFKFQPRKQLIQRVIVRNRSRNIRRGHLQRDVADDGRKHQALFRHLPSFEQFFALSVFDKRIINIVIYRLHRAEFLHQPHRGLLADARNTRNVVRRVAHQSLEIDHVNRIKAVLLAEHLGRVVGRRGLTAARHNQKHVRPLPDQLEGVLVAGDQQAGVPVFIRLPAQCAEQIVRLKSRFFQTRNAHRLEHLVHDRKLNRQLVRHSLPRTLVRLVLLVAEGLLPHVKTHRNAVRLVFLAQTQQCR